MIKSSNLEIGCEGKVIEELDMTQEKPMPKHPYAMALFDPWSVQATEWLKENKNLDMNM